MRSLVAAASLLCAVSTLALSQRVSGIVQVAGAQNFVSGVVVTTIDSAGRTIARTLSDQNGRYSLPLAPNAARVRAMRIGFRPATVEIVRSAGDAQADITMARAPVVLETVRISADGTCGGGEQGRIAGDFWEQARSALLAAIVAREANPARVDLLEYQRRMDRSRRLITEQRVQRTSGLSTRPVAAARSGAMLAMSGYRATERDADVHFAPDADVLFDESFAAAHCFGVTPGSRERAGQIGLTFKPRNTQRDFVDVTGTLWLSPQATELLDLEFQYTGVDPEATRAGAGGAMRFRTMPNGVVFIDSWSILIPTMTEIRQRGAGGSPTARGVVNDLVETGGYVLAASWNDGTKWSEPLGGIRGTVRAKSGTDVDGVLVAAPGASTATNNLGAYSLPLPPGRYRVGLIDSAFAGYAEPREQTREIVVTRSDAVTVDFEIPSRESILGDLCRDHRGSGASVLLGLIEDRSAALPGKLRVRSAWVSSRSRSNEVELDRLAQSSNVSPVTSSGRFYVCGVPASSSWISLRLELDGTTVADTALPPSMIDAPTRSGVRQFDWPMPSGIFEAAMRGDAAVLRGRVVKDGNGVSNAQVWVVFADTTVTTDSLGRFRVGGLRAGPQMVEIRKIGYAVTRDTVLLRPRAETVRDFVVGPQLLDTMETRGKGRAYDAPRLQEFERRRLSGMGGHFVSEDDLRAMEHVSTPSIMRTRFPGIRFHTYRGGTYAAAFSSPNGGASQLGPNGPTGCWVAIYLDGGLVFDQIKNTPPMYEMPPNIDNFMPIGLSGIEYYQNASSTPLQFKSLRNTCGALVLWTRGK